MRLHLQVLQQQQQLDILEEGLADLQRYLRLEKFQVDEYVHRDDILMRIDEIKQQQFRGL